MIQKILRPLVALIVATLIFSNCSDTNTQVPSLNQEKVEIVKKSTAEQYAYVEKNLITIQKAFLPQTQNPDFRNLLYKEVEKAFDGDENVLIHRLFDLDKNLMSQIVQSRFLTGKDKLDQSLNAFKNVGTATEHFDLYPQIYIHNYWNLKERGLNESPIVVAYNGNESEILEGLRLNSQGEIEKVQVDESIARENEVWVISLNEHYKGEPFENFVAKAKISNGRTKYTGACISTPNCLRDNTDWTDMNMNTFMISCRKETWAAGNSDVSITRLACFEKEIHPVWEQYWPAEWLGDMNGWVDLISIDEAYQDHCFEMTNPVYQGMNPDDEVDNASSVDGDILFYLIFEHDNWPAPQKTQEVKYYNQDYPQTYTTFNLPFRSQETAFVWGVVTAKPIYRNCGYFGCGYYSEQGCDSFGSSGCAEVDFKTVKL